MNQIVIEEDTVLSVYNWITDNISYDVANLDDLTDRSKRSNIKSTKSEAERKQAKLEKVIKQKKGVCEDYSLLLMQYLMTLDTQHIL